MIKNTIKIFALFLCVPFLAQAEIKGRAEVASLYMNIRLKESGHTIKKYDMGGGRFDATILPFDGPIKGVCFKPFAFGGAGNKASIVSTGVMLGHYTPINKCITVIPMVGVSHTRFWGDNIHINITDPIPLGTRRAKQMFHSTSLVVGSEFIYTINDKMVISFIYNYGWAHTNSVIRAGEFMGIPLRSRSRGQSKGSNFACVFDYYINDCWSISAGAGYNRSLSKERHGLSGVGGKLGIARLF